MPVRSQSLCQSVRHHILRWAVFQPCRSIFDTIPNEMVLNVDMLGASMVLRVVCQCNGALVIAVDDVLVVDAVVDFSEKTEEPYLLLEGM